jgi:hypothetical protein
MNKPNKTLFGFKIEIDSNCPSDNMFWITSSYPMKILVSDKKIEPEIFFNLT